MMNTTTNRLAPTLPRQTTVLFGGSNGTKTLISILGDKSNPDNINHTLRIVTRNPSQFLQIKPPASKKSPPSPEISLAINPPNQQEIITWRCQEQKHFSNLLPASFIPSTWTTHVGKPDAVFGYSDDDLEAAISGINGLNSDYNADDGGVADVLILACPVAAHLSILRQIARALYKLDAENKLLSKSAPPLLIGTLYSAGGFDWMCRLAFHMEKPPGFLKWKRELGLFGLRSFPYLCKSLQKGEVTLFGRFPQLGLVVSPSTEIMREEVRRRVMGRVLQGDENGVKMAFMGLDERNVEPGNFSDSIYNVNGISKSAGAAAASVVAAQFDGRKIRSVNGAVKVNGSVNGAVKINGAVNGAVKVNGSVNSSVNGVNGTLNGSALEDLDYSDLDHSPSAFQHIRSITDLADPFSALGFLSCTLNATNQILHPCIIYALFNTPSGEISWPESQHSTPYPRFYADGANLEAGKAITSIAVGEYYPLMSILDTILAPSGMQPICNQHGGEPLGRFGLTKVGNHPNDIAERSGLMDKVIYGIQTDKKVKDVVNYRNFCNWCMHKGLSINSRLGYVLAPATRDAVNKDMIKPITSSRFFLDDLPHGLCVVLGLGEMLGFDLEKDMPMTLKVVRRLQAWMGKEYVQPAGALTRGKGIVGGARDLKETSAPQAFGVWTVEDLKRFLSISPFGEEVGKRVDLNIKGSALMQEKIIQEQKIMQERISSKM